MKELLSMLIRGLCILALVFAGACATVEYQADPDSIEDDIRRLNDKLAENSNDAEALRDIGALYFQSKRYDLARNYLQRSIQQNDKDPKTLFFVGMSAEFDGKESLARNIYQKYPDMPRFSPYRKLMAGRYNWLLREEARLAAKKLIQDPLNAPAVANDAVAVFPMIYQGNNPRFSAVGRGLSEMLLIDLGEIAGVRTVERIRTQALINELEISNSRYVDPNTSPRHGKLLGAGKVVGGVYDVLVDRDLKVNASSWNLAQDDAPEIHNKQDLLRNLFLLQKELLIEILQQLNIQLSREDKEKLIAVPTRNVEAFLQYCLGLEREDNREFDLATGYYTRALELDPNFTLAATRKEVSEGLDAAGGTLENAMNSALKADAPTSKSSDTGQASILDTRLQSLGNNIGAGFANGDESRKGVEEAVGARAGIGPLPEPPPPSGSGGNN